MQHSCLSSTRRLHVSSFLYSPAGLPRWHRPLLHEVYVLATLLKAWIVFSCAQTLISHGEGRVSDVQRPSYSSSALFLALQQRDAVTSSSLFPKCPVDMESKNNLECQNIEFSCRFGASTTLSRFCILSQLGWTFTYCCEKPHVNGLGLYHLAYFLFNMWHRYFSGTSPIRVMVEKEQMLHTLHEIAPSPPLSFFISAQ